MQKRLTYAAAGLLAAGLLVPATHAVAGVGGPPTSCTLGDGTQGQVLHCDKIVFELHPKLAEPLQLRPKAPLDIKVCDDGTTVADLKGEVMRHLGVAGEPRVGRLIRITDVEYSTLCIAFPAPLP